MSTSGDAVLVAGAGAWGTALALVLAANGGPVYLWGRDRAAIERMASIRENAIHLPGIPLPAAIEPVADLARVPPGVATVLLATPFQAQRDVLALLVQAMPAVCRFVSAAKGVELASHRLGHEIMADVLGAATPVALLSGPTFAREVAEGRPAAITVAASDWAFGHELVGRLHGPQFRPYLTDDLVGVAVGGALKNVLAIAAGVADGLGLGANSRAALITRGLAEIARLGSALGGRMETFMGLSGLGDLVLTCTDDQSRNRRFGLALGRGQSITEALAESGLVEGMPTAVAAVALAARRGVQMPIAEQVAGMLRDERSPREAVTALMGRDPGVEYGGLYAWPRK